MTAGWECEAATKARVEELSKLLVQVQLLHDLWLGKFPAMTDAHRQALQETTFANLLSQLNANIAQELAQDPALARNEKHLMRAAAADKAHQRGDKLVIDGAFTTASNELRETSFAAKPWMIRTSYRWVKEQQSNMREMTRKALQLSKKFLQG